MKLGKLGFILPLLLCGCSLLRHPVAEPAVAASIGTTTVSAVTTAASAQRQLTEASDNRLSQLSANVNAASTAVDAGEIPVAKGELTVAKARLSDVKPDPVEVAAAAERRLLVESGKAEEARAAYTLSANQARSDAAKISDLESKYEEARAKADSLTAQLVKISEQNRVSNQKLIDSAVEKANNKVIDGQVSKLNWAGAGCIIVAIGALGLGLGIGGLPALSRVGPLAFVAGLGALICFGAAQIVGAWWFLYVIGTVIAVIVTWLAIWFYKHQKAGDLAAEVATRSAKIAAVAQATIPVLDEAYDKAEKPIKDWLDEHVFNVLSKVMDKPDKSAVHEIRAENISK